MARIAQIVSTARYLPEHVVTNAELTARFAALGRPDVINKLAARTVSGARTRAKASNSRKSLVGSHGSR